MPPKGFTVLSGHHFRWTDIVMLPLRLVQICFTTVVMFLGSKVWNRAEQYCDAHTPNKHAYRPPIKPSPGVAGDVRSPCPALNTLANHGFLPRDGRNIYPGQFIHALQHGYNISYALAAFLTWGSFILLRQWGSVSLADLARHGCVEHDASLGHEDALSGAEYAPTWWDSKFVQRLLDHSTDGAGLRLHDIAMARVQREAEYAKPLDPVHAEIARGEMGMVLALFGRWVPKLPATCDVPPSPTVCSSSPPVTPHFKQHSIDSTSLSASSSSCSTTSRTFDMLTARSSQVTLINPSRPASPDFHKISFASPIDSILASIRTGLIKRLHPLSPPSQTVYSDSGESEELELSVPLDIVHRWWTREELPRGFHTASMVIPARDSDGLLSQGEDDGVYSLKTQNNLGFPEEGEGIRVVGFLETVQLSLGIKKAMADIRRKGY